MGKRIVLFLDNPSIPTGYGSTCRLTVKELRKLGYDCYGISFNGGAQSNSLIEWYGIKILPNLALSRNDSSGYGDSELVRYINRTYSPDIFFFHNDAYRFSYIKELPKEILDRSVFWLPFEGTHPDVGGIEILRLMAATRFVSHSALDLHKDILSGHDVGVIPHAVDLDSFFPTTNKEESKAQKALGLEGKFVVCRVDRHQPRKQWAQTIKSFAKFAKDKKDVFLLAKCNPRDCSLYDSAKKEGVDLEAMAQEHGLVLKKPKSNEFGNIFFDDYFFSNDFVAKGFYHPADVFLTTTSGEGFGLTVVEAMACGVPIICPDVPVLPEVVGEAGMFCSISGKEWYDPLQLEHNLVNTDDVASKLEACYLDWKSGGKMLAQKGKKAREIVERKFSPSIVYNQWDKIFAEVSSKVDKASIITVLYNLVDDQIDNPEYGVQNFLDSMEKYVTSEYEWIIVDNGSPAREKTRAWMEEAARRNPKIRCFYQDVNLGFAGGCNLGISKATGGNIILCNPDSQALNPKTHAMSKDFIGTMFEKAASNPDIGIVGMHLNERDDVLNGLNFPYFCCVLITRRCLDSIKLGDNEWFDEKFWPGYYEDADLTLRAQSKGFKVVECNCPFYHVSGGSNRHAIEGGKDGPHVKHFKDAINILSSQRPDMADWERKERELTSGGMQSMISGNIKYLNDKWGASARSSIKVVFHTTIGANVGFSLIVEGLAPELAELGFDVYINDWSNKANIDNPVIGRMVDKYYEANAKGKLSDAIHVVVWLMETFQHVEADFKVGVSFCESTKVRDSYLSLCNSMDRILTFSNFCRSVQRDSGFTPPIDVLPFGVHPSFLRYHKRERKNTFTFLSVGVSQGRKNLGDLVRTFCEAFPKDQKYPPDYAGGFPYENKDVFLVLKSNNFGELDWVKQQGWDKKANIVTTFTGNDAKAERGDYSLEEMYDLYCSADSYIHPSHGEGIGLPIMEAAATGLAPLFTNWSTPAEFLDESCSYPIPLPPYLEMAFGKAYEGAPGDNGVWANPSLPHMKQLMYDVILDREKAEAKGRLAADRMYQEHDWKKCARAMMPLLFDWDAQRKRKNPVIDFDPMTFEKPRLERITPEDRILIDIVTRDRHEYLCSLLTSLLMQTFKNWDLVIQCDDKDESMPKDFQIQSLMHRCWHEGHSWQILRSQRQGPHIAHDRSLQVALKDPRKWKLICRIDDDIYVKPDYLEKMFKVFLDDEACQVAAVGGVYMDPRRPDTEQTAPPGWESDINYAGLIEPNVMYPYVCHYPPGTPPRRVEHLYSSYLFRAKCGEAIGGYCKLFSPVGHREESDFSYRFHIAGWKLYIQPGAKGYHYHAPSGGIRSNGISNHMALAINDNKIYERRLSFWRKRMEEKKLASKSVMRDDPDPRYEDKRKQTVAIISGSGYSHEDATSHFLRFANKVYLVAESPIPEWEHVEVVKNIDEAESRASSDETARYVIRATGNMRFEENPLRFLSADFSDYVFEVHQTYAPGSRRIGETGVLEFVWKPSLEKVIGPEAREECLISSKSGKPQVRKCQSMVLEDKNIVPEGGCSVMGNKLMTVTESKNSRWVKYITSTYESRINPRMVLGEPVERVVNGNEKNLVSIIIPTAGRKHLLKRCIDSIYAYTRFPFEIIMIDNGSSDGTGQMLEQMQEGRQNIKIHRNKENLGYQKAINQAVRASSGDYLLFFNDDAWVEGYQPDGRDWVQTLVDEIQDERIGVVGPHPCKSPTLGIDMLFFWCVMMRRKTYETIGPFDERFFNYGGDDDYCKRVLDSGLQIKQRILTNLRHQMTCVPDEVKKPALEESRRILREKYGIEEVKEEQKEKSKPSAGRKRVLIYALGQGLGHVTRAISAGRFLASDAEVNILTDSALAYGVISGGFEEVNVEGCKLRFLANPGEGNKNAILMLDESESDMVIVDCFPAGIKDELEDWLPSYKGKKVLVLQRMLPSYLDPRKRLLPLYDGILLCEKSEHPLRVFCMETDPWLIRCRTELLVREKALEILGCDGSKKVVVVVCCGQKEEVQSMAEFSERLSKASESDVRLVGPGGLQYWPVLELMEGIDLVVGQPGYSLASEVRATGTPFMAVVRERIFESQEDRLKPAEAISESDIELVSQRISSLPPTRTVRNYSNGAVQASGMIKSILKGEGGSKS